LFDPVEIRIGVRELLQKHGSMSLEQIVQGLAAYGGSMVPSRLVGSVIAEMNLRLQIDPDGDGWKLAERRRGFMRRQAVADQGEPGAAID
jgi:hypothetical protein